MGRHATFSDMYSCRLLVNYVYSGVCNQYTTSTWTTTIPTSPSSSVTKTDFDTTIYNKIKHLLANFDDKHAKRFSKKDVKFKETIEETIAYQDENFDAKFKKSFKPCKFRSKKILPGFI